MTENNESIIRLKHTAPLRMRVLRGAGVAAILMIVLTILALATNEITWPWTMRWVLFPVVFVSAAGAAGGTVFYVTDSLRYRSGR